MEKLKGKFWTNIEDMIEDLENIGYDFIDILDDYLYVMDIDDRHSEFPTELRYPVVIANDTITIKF